MTEGTDKPHERTERVEPGVSDALIGLAIGLALLYAGPRIRFRLARWPVVGIGWLFVLVMTSFVAVTVWQRLLPCLRPVFDRARGRVRHDPLLGTLVRNPAARLWVATVTRGDRTVDIDMQGDDEPDPACVLQARELVARFDTLEREVHAYLAREAATDASEDPNMPTEIRALQVSALLLRSSDRPGRVAIDFKGPDETRYWYCDYVDGELTGLDFDT